MAQTELARYPYPTAITAYGGGGFRFAEMSHKGSLLCLPSGIYAWSVDDPVSLSAEALQPALDEAERIEILLLGTGPAQVFATQELRARFAESGISLESMATGAAARTYNVLLAEGRAVAAAMIAVP